MKLGRISFFFLFLFLLLPFVSYAQSSADKSWNSFWVKFTAAAKAKNVSAIERLSVSGRDFSNGGGAGTRRQLIAESLGIIKTSVSKGTKAYNDSNRPGRITQDNALVFEFFNKRWWFVGFMGD